MEHQHPAIKSYRFLNTEHLTAQLLEIPMNFLPGKSAPDVGSPNNLVISHSVPFSGLTEQ